jgi:ACS family tartrate transporter-like MFS transporter
MTQNTTSTGKEEHDILATKDAVSMKDIMRKVGFRLMPILIAGQIFAYMDPVNVGFAALTANKDIGLSPAQYGFGASLLFISYVLCEFPSNLMLRWVGTRIWISRIMVTWGLVSGCMAFVVGPNSFYAVRFLLGAAEAGFFPGVLLYITYWFPSEYRARYIAMFQIGIPLASVIGSPLSATILSFDQILGLKGWQWIYILEALPPLLIGLIGFFYLTDRPSQAKWLAPSERQAIQNQLDLELETTTYVSRWGEGLGLLADKRVLFYSVLYFSMAATSVGLSLWLPQIIKAFSGASIAMTGVLSAIPFALGMIAMPAWSWVSDRIQERRWCSALPSLLVAVTLGSCMFTDSAWLQMVFISISGIGIYAVKGPVLSLITEGLAGSVGVGGLAIVSSLGNLSGVVAPAVIGWIRSSTGSFALGLLFLAFVAVIGGILPLLTRRPVPLPAAQAA